MGDFQVREAAKVKVPYNPKLKKRAKELRRDATFSEKVLWKYLKSSQVKGYKFTRQKPIGNYIVDFYCPKLRLVIEVDGESHNEKQEYDKKRQMILEKMGLYVLRFDGYSVIEQTESVLNSIYNKMEDLEKTTP